MNTHPIPDAALHADIAILAQKGAGKTYTAKGIIEELLDQGARVLVVDPLSVWWGLKASGDGQGPGYPVAVFGGPHGDMPLTEAMAEPLAKTLAHTNLPAVLDVAWMKKAEQMRFCAKLFETLFAENRDPLTLVLEEAHVFAPQSMTGGDAHCFHQVDRIARMGRAFGFRLVTITQRPARLHKDVLTQAAGMIALRMQHPLDQKPILDWFTANGDKAFAKKVESGLANLSTGEAFIGFPDQSLFSRVTFPRINSFDSSATPKRGVKRIEPKTLAQVDLTAIKAALSLPDPAPASATVPKDWEAETARREKAARTQGYDEGYKAGHAEGSIDGLRRGVDALKELINGAPSVPKAPAPAAEPRKPSAPSKPVSDALQGDGVLTGPERSLLAALGFWHGLGHEAPSRAMVAGVAGWRVTSGHLKNVAGSLRTKGLIEYPKPDHIGLTMEGLAAAPEAPAGQPIDLIRPVLSGPQIQVVETLAARGRLSRSDLCGALGWNETSGHVKNVLGSLRSLQVVQYPQQGYVELEDWLTPEGVTP